jgi:hypothetical protein
VRGEFIICCDVSPFDTGAGSDPFVTGVHESLEVFIRHNLRRCVSTERTNARPRTFSRFHIYHVLVGQPVGYLSAGIRLLLRLLLRLYLSAAKKAVITRLIIETLTTTPLSKPPRVHNKLEFTTS